MPDLSLVCIGCVFVEMGIGVEGVIVDVGGFEEGNMIRGAGGGTMFGGETFLEVKQCLVWEKVLV
jgi:hypothetical protein